MKNGIRGVAALAAIAGLLLTGCAKPSLPAEEPSGETTESFGDQEPRWSNCGDFECADVYAPLDWADPAGEKITLSLVKRPALGGEAKGTLFVNPGGPGASGIEYLTGNVDNAVQPEVQQDYDVVAWDPRGVGKSTPVQCLDAKGLDEFLFGAGSADGMKVGSDEWIAANLKDATAFGDACEKESGDLLAHVSTGDTVQDLDMLREVVGDDKLNYLGYSYGTYIGARYADAYPDRVGRLVLDAAMDPSTSLEDVVREQTIGFEQALRAYLADCLTRQDCPFSGSVDEAMGLIGDLLDHVEANPIEGSDGRMLTSGTMITAIITPLYSQQSWPYLDQLLASVNQDNADVAFALADMYYNRENGKYLDNSTEAFTAINCLDYADSPADHEAMRKAAAELERVAPTIGKFQGYGDISCAGWPVKSTTVRGPVEAKGAAPILVVGTTGDPATPYKWAQSLSTQLDSGVLVTFKGEGHAAYGTSSCVNGVVNDYFLTDAVPASDPNCSV